MMLEGTPVSEEQAAASWCKLNRWRRNCNDRFAAASCRCRCRCLRRWQYRHRCRCSAAQVVHRQHICRQRTRYRVYCFM